MAVSLLAAACLLASASGPRIGLALSVPEGGGEEQFVQALRDQIRLGLDGTAQSHKWSELERQPGQIDVKPFSDGAGILSLLGGEGLATLQTIDTNQVVLPADLSGRAFDSPEVLARWKALLDRVVPSLGPRVKWLSLGNEVDARLARHEDETEPFLRLLAAGREEARRLRPGLQISVTVTASGLLRRPDLCRRLMEGMDFTCVTYYAQGDDFGVIDPARIQTDLEKLLAFDPGRPVVLQELGMAADPLLGGSEEKQAAFVRQALRFVSSHGSRVPLAVFFLQCDFPAAMVDGLTAYYGVSHPRFRAYLAALGLKDSHGRPRKAWDAFKQELSALKPF